LYLAKLNFISYHKSVFTFFIKLKNDIFNFFNKPKQKIEKEFQVRPNQIGCLFKNNQLESLLKAGIYKYEDENNELAFLAISTVSKNVRVLNQDVLSKDNIALRFSYFLNYYIENVELLLQKIDLSQALNQNNEYYIFPQIEVRLNNLAHLHIRRLISSIESEELNEKRNEIADFKNEALIQEVASFGVCLESAFLRDLTFPKNIQDLFAKQLEAKIRAKADLENARTTVATARALKNASELVKDDDNIRFFQFLETINKIA
jgi:regulator of protease activity HflC (stomatin/prohibitin superfamily)